MWGERNMTHIQVNAIIETDAHRVWTVLTHPRSITRLNPHIQQLASQPSPLGGYNQQWAYMMGRMKLFTQAQIVRYVEAQHLNIRLVGELCGQWTYWLESDGYWSHIALTIDYELPFSKVGAALHALVLEPEQMMLAQLQLERLRQFCERKAA